MRRHSQTPVSNVTIMYLSFCVNSHHNTITTTTTTTVLLLLLTIYRLLHCLHVEHVANFYTSHTVWSVCLRVLSTTVSCAKTTELTVGQFGWRLMWDQEITYSVGSTEVHMGRGNFCGCQPLVMCLWMTAPLICCECCTLFSVHLPYTCSGQVLLSSWEVSLLLFYWTS